MCLLLMTSQFLKYYNATWSKVCKSIKKELDREPVYNNKSLKPKTRSGKSPTDFHGKDTSEVGFD